MIFKNPLKMNIYFYHNAIDMRKSWNGLIAIVKEDMELSVFSESIFVFSGKNGKLVKILYWDGNGFCIWMKKLEKGKFYSLVKKGYRLTSKELYMFLSGIDMRKKHTELFYED